MRARASAKRFGVTVFVALGAITAFAVMGGTGLAGGLAKPAKNQYAPGQYEGNAKKVTICHKERVTLRISVNALPAHVKQHDDTLGPCAAAAAKAKGDPHAKVDKATKAAKAAKAKKAKDEATDEGTPSASSGTGQSHGKTNGNGNGKGNGKK